MDKIKKFFDNFIKCYLYIAVFTQIVIGTVYFVCHFFILTEYPETKELVQAARTMVFDEYIGFLYPLFVRMCLVIQNVFGIGYYILVHLGNLIFFIFSVYYMLRSFWSKKRAVIGGLYVTSFPFCMQSILMVSSFTWKAAFGFFIIGAMIRIYKKKRSICIKSGVVLVIAYLLAVCNQPDDLYVWLIPILIVVFVLLCRKKEMLSWFSKIGIVILCVLMFFSGICIQNTVIEKGARGRMQKNIYSVLFQRTLWPDLVEKYGFLPAELQECIQMDEAVSSNQYAEYMETYIGPKIERQFGIEKSKVLYKEAVWNQLSYNKRSICKSVGTDFVGYLFEPYTTLWHINGQSGSAFGKLYSLMSAGNEKNVYVYFCISFVSLFSITFCGILSVIRRKVLVKKGIGKKIAACMVMLGYQALFYAIVNVQGVDYRYVLLQTGLFLILALQTSLFYEEEELIDKTNKMCLKKKRIIFAGIASGSLVFLGVVLLLNHRGIKESQMLEDKVIVCFGDSILAMEAEGKSIVSYIEKMTGAKVINCAVSGSSASVVLDADEQSYEYCNLYQIAENLEKGEEVSSNSFMQTILDVSLQDADILLLEYGLNDYFKGSVIEDEEKSGETYIGAIQYAIHVLRNKYPNLQIVLLSQTYCQFYSYGIVEQDSDTYFTGNGVGTDYVNALKKCAEEESVNFVDCYTTLPINKYNGTLYLSDGTHFTDKGYKVYGRLVSEYLLDNFSERKEP